MAIPDFQSVMLPFLKLASDRAEHPIRDAKKSLADSFKLTETERQKLVPSGSQEVWANRIGWSRTYLKHAGLIEYTRRGHFRITERGLNLLAENPAAITVDLLKRFPEFAKFLGGKDETDKESGEKLVGNESQTPEELIEQAHRPLTNALVIELIQKLKTASPQFFERVVVEVLVRMGYGGSRQEAGRAIGQSGDEGIDGVINEDRLGLDAVYIQAKRWEGVVGRPEIMKFVGALQGKRAHKGVFITTSGFTREAQQYIENVTNKVVLIDGPTFARLMIEHNVGVTQYAVYELKRIDSDFFSEE
jgi:restriction system protein